MNVSFNPIGSWALLAPLAVLVVGLSLWVYVHRLRGTLGRWRWVALSLRVLAMLLCLAAALRPSLLLLRKEKLPTSIVFLMDVSKSMTIKDQAHDQARSDAARDTERKAKEFLKKYAPGIEAKFFKFAETLQNDRPEDAALPVGNITALGTALVEAAKQSAGTKVVAIVPFSDFNNTGGIPPLLAAQQLRGQQIPVVGVIYGNENANNASRDIAVRELTAGPTVFSKQEVQVTGAISVRGFPTGEKVEVELLAEGRDGKPAVVDKTTIQVKELETVTPVRGLKWTPDRPGDTKVSLRVAPKDRELLTNNNEMSTFVTVLGGGINVMYVQASPFSWESRYLVRALDASDRIRVDLRHVRQAGEIRDEELAPGRYDAIILGDVPAEFLTDLQQNLVYRGVENGAGLLMLGGRRSFGVGGWSNSKVADLLPVNIHPGDGQLEPADGVKVVPDRLGLENYVTRLSADRAQSARIWALMPPIPGANRFSGLKRSAIVLASTPPPDNEPIMIATEFGKGRALAFAGETWPWARDFSLDEVRAAHRRIWRQAILWLTHKEDDGESKVQLTLDRRRVALGDKLGISVSASDAKGEPIPDIKYEVRVEPLAPAAKSEAVDVFAQGKESLGNYFATGKAGDYRVSVVGTHNGKEVGSAKARFLIYQDDRELENTAADLAILSQIAEITGGKSLRPESLEDYLKTLKSEITTEYLTQKEQRLWDKWPFFLAFVIVLTGEWWLRKRNGWV
jgi:uncharacterized membrane protein